ncbi:MAG TPA: ATP-binding protein, partial [Opitutus sp.]|nr:ATP-binding protein [Opitutus sp.]
MTVHLNELRAISSAKDSPTAGAIAVSKPAHGNVAWAAFRGPFTDGARGTVIGRISLHPGNEVSWEPFAVPGLDQAGEIAALFLDDRGILWIGAEEGVLRFDPSELTPAGAPHTPRIRANVPPETALAADNSLLEFDFAPLEYSRPASIRYQTRLAPSQAEWSAPTANGHLALAGLRDGSYTLEVRSINDAGLTSPPVSWRFTVLPPWYRTKTAYGAWAVLTLAGFFGVYQWRSAYLRKRNALLEELVRKKTEQLEKANAAKSDFLANMSHEIRNPISGIVGLSLAMEETSLDPRQRDLTGSIRSCASLLATLVDDVLDFSKIEAGKIDLRVAPFELRAALEQCAAMVAEQLRSAGGGLHLQIADDVPPRVVGDSARVQQIVLNYLTNAAKFGAGQPVVLGAELRPDGLVRLFVRDRGPGLTPAEAAGLFTKFTRLPQAHAHNIRGSGLGLAVCRLLATKMGGNVGVDSTPGQGSCFWADLPLAPAGKPAEGDARRTTPAVPLRALIVEDIDYNAQAMQAVLRKLGIPSDVASDGPSALERLQQGSYDVAFMDWNLPGMIGTEVVRRYRATEPADRRTIIIATTAYSADFNREACLQAGMDAF